jgi:hypothetical protein
MVKYGEKLVQLIGNEEVRNTANTDTLKEDLETDKTSSSATQSE